jgi:hypothetical protein
MIPAEQISAACGRPGLAGRSPQGSSALPVLACIFSAMDNNIVLDLTALMHGGVWHRQSGKLDLRDQSRLSEG